MEFRTGRASRQMASARLVRSSSREEANSHATQSLRKRNLIRPNRLAYRLFGDPKFVAKDFQITHKPEQKQGSRRGLPTVQLGYVLLIVWHNSIFPWLTYGASVPANT